MKKQYIITFVQRTYQQITAAWHKLKTRWARVHFGSLEAQNGPYYKGYFTVINN